MDRICEMKSFCKSSPAILPTVEIYLSIELNCIVITLLMIEFTSPITYSTLIVLRILV